MINKTCPLILNDLYHYDISMCYFTILKSIGWDMSNINMKDKEERNKQIGYIQKNYPNLSKYLLNCTKNIIDEYLEENSIDESELIIRQRDGIIITRKLNRTNITVPIDFRYSILKLIICTKRRMFLMIKSDGNIEVKGVSNKPADTSFYNMFNQINFGSKRLICDSIEKMRQSFFRSSNIKWFAIQNDNSYSIKIKEFDSLFFKLNLSTLKMIDHNTIDKYFIWNKYIWPFCQSIIITYL